MNWKCKFGFHDWVILEKYDKFDVKMAIIFGDGTPEFQYTESIIPLIKKICIRCCKFKDSITPYKQKIETKINLQKERQQKANQLYENNSHHIG